MTFFVVHKSDLDTQKGPENVSSQDPTLNYDQAA
jgi:hypothetical protein